MAKVEISQLEGPALDWAVARCRFADRLKHTPPGKIEVEPMEGSGEYEAFSVSRNWAQGGPIIDDFGISLEFTEKQHSLPRCDAMLKINWNNL